MNQQLLDSFFDDLRLSLQYGVPIDSKYDHSFKFDNNISQIYVTLFQSEKSSIRWGSRKESLSKTLSHLILKLRENKNFHHFKINDNSTCRILFEIVTKEYECNIRNITTMRMHSCNRFEPGVNGLKYTYDGITRFFMPTDGYTKSIMSVNQLLNYLSKQCGIAKKTDKIS